MKSLLPAGWPRPKGYANGIAVQRPADLRRRHGRLGRETVSSRATTSRRRPGSALENVAAVLRAAGAKPEHIVRMTWYVTEESASTSTPAARGRRGLPARSSATSTSR